MVIRRLEVDIEQVVIQIGNRRLDSDPGKSYRLKSQIRHYSVNIMRDGLIHFQIDLITGFHLRRLCQMIAKDLSCQVLSHGHLLIFMWQECLFRRSLVHDFRILSLRESIKVLPWVWGTSGVTGDLWGSLSTGVE